MSKRLTKDEMREYQRRRRALLKVVKPECKAIVNPPINVKPIVKPLGEDSLAIIKRLTGERDELAAQVMKLESKLRAFTPHVEAKKSPYKFGPEWQRPISA